MKQFRIIIEKHSDGYLAYPLGIKGAVVGEGDTYEEALADVKSAIRCYIGVTFTNYGTFDTKGIGYITIGMFFNDDSKLFHLRLFIFKLT